jgi:hypothetical protein
MTRRTMGLGAMPGGGLAGAASQQGKEAMTLLGAAAEQEQARDISNKQMEQTRQQGNQALGSAVGGMAGWAIGAKIGASLGPWGAAAGAVLGAVAGGLF